MPTKLPVDAEATPQLILTLLDQFDFPVGRRSYRWGMVAPLIPKFDARIAPPTLVRPSEVPLWGTKLLGEACRHASARAIDRALFLARHHCAENHPGKVAFEPVAALAESGPVGA